MASAALHRDIHVIPKRAVGGKGSYIFLEDGQKILDSTGGAAVSCLGHGNEDVTKAVLAQMNQLSYCHTAFFGTQPYEELASLLVESTGGRMSKLFVISSGTSFSHPCHRGLMRLCQLTSMIKRLRSHGGSHKTSSAVLLGVTNP